ncbi:MAG: hypothetical protein CR217_14895 [Beijerinckiaceae bacterium]|nr:MAG: hypothetical protein CR217_14895 [Beijerinckiaceae bacterium]
MSALLRAALDALTATSLSNGTKQMIDMKLVRTNFYTRWPCDVCGGCTEKVEWLCEGQDIDGYGVRVCEVCLEAGQDQIDNRLEAHLKDREKGTLWLRSLIGRLNIPTFDEWRRAEGPIDERTGERLPVGGPVELEPPEWDHLMVGAAAGGRCRDDFIIDDDIPF